MYLLFVVGNKGSSSTQSKPNKKAEKAEIDFLNMDPVDTETLFAKPSSAATITLPKTVLAERSQQWHLLPEDLHMTSDTLLRLFMKPEGKTVRVLLVSSLFILTYIHRWFSACNIQKHLRILMQMTLLAPKKYRLLVGI